MCGMSSAELTPGHVYVYTFATPNVCTDTAERRDSKYRNIFNIVNPEDVVPEVPFLGAPWGYWHLWHDVLSADGGE